MQPTQAIKEWLVYASKRLSSVNIPSPSLDSEIILAFVLGQDRTYLHAHSDQKLDSLQISTANSKLEMRYNRTPIAYITGHKEFYGRDFIVTPFTLIPRPESEAIISAVYGIKKSGFFKNKSSIEIVDVGTGSGCLAITLKKEFPEINITALDISNDALEVCKNNAHRLNAEINILHSDLLKSYQSRPDIIVANLPYVDKKWKRSPETDHEPTLALFADDGGKIIIKTLILQSSNFLSPGGYLILEADPQQHEAIEKFAIEQSFKLIDKFGYTLVFSFQY